MKSTSALSSVSLLGSIALLGSLLAAPAHASPARDRDRFELGDALREVQPPRDVRRISRGMTRDQVIVAMQGRPHETAPQVWIYWGFHGLNRPQEMQKPTLVVYFEGERVREIRYSEERFVRLALAEQRKAEQNILARR
jgi:outer membrane protein assembly factor BamE (lipoprotein component of BamABCDE complex)